MTQTTDDAALPDPPIDDAPADVIDAAPARTVDAPADVRPIVARASNDYRVRRYIMVALLIGAGGWFAYDGLVKWPRINREIAALRAEQVRADADGDTGRVGAITEELKDLGDEHGPLAIFFQKLLAVACPLAGVAYLGWTQYNSRGEVRLDESDVLHAPGHPPVPLANVTAVDRSRWDRKGIADLAYALPDGPSGRVRLDDFVYQREPIDAIYDRAVALHPAPPRRRSL